MPKGFIDKLAFDEETQTERFTRAEDLAQQHNHVHVDFEHLLWVDTSSDNSLIYHLFERNLNETLERSWLEFKQGLLDLLRQIPAIENKLPITYSAALIDVTDSLSSRHPRQGHNLERTIQAVSKRRGPGEPLKWSDLLQAIIDYRPHSVVPHVASDFGLVGAMLDQPFISSSKSECLPPNTLTESLTRYVVDMTESAANGDFTDAIGREREVQRLITILCRKEANNPILLGDAGVGKTKIVEGLALRIAENTVHPKLQNKRILGLDMGLLVAGAQYLGQFEERLKSLLRELKAARGTIILFVDEIHQLLGLGRTSGAMDAANLMKPALARGELWCIGATTYEEYRHLEADPALRRRFQPVDIPEQDIATIIEVVRRVAPIYEKYHHVEFSEESINELVRMGRRYIGGASSPAREVGLLDEIGAEIGMRERERGDLKTVNVQPADVASAVSHRTGIPVERMSRGRRERIAQLEQTLSRRVFGQAAIIRSVVLGIRRSLAGLSAPSRPRAVFFFAGPSGVGKTELAKAIAEELYDSADAMVRLDMSEFGAETARNRLIGSDPGYVGYEEGGRLTEAVRRRPYSLILLDEFEKAHPTVWRLFLQVLDDGRLSDSKGRIVSFSETVIVMTSNVGATLVAKARELNQRIIALRSSDKNEQRTDVELHNEALRTLDNIIRTVPDMNPQAYEILEDEAQKILRGEVSHVNSRSVVRKALLAVRGFPPELFGRIGEPLVFNGLAREHLSSILDQLLIDLCIRIANERVLPVPVSPSEEKEWFMVRHDPEGFREVICQSPREGSPLAGVRLSREIADMLVEKGYDPLIGARALRSLFEEKIETEVAQRLIQETDTGPVFLSV